MAWNINSAKLVIEIVDDSTGEVITREATLGDFKEVTPKKATTTRTKKPKDSDLEPKIYLEDNKIKLNNKAVELTGFEPEQKINILFEKKGRTITPVICIDDKNGNRLTKTYTVSCRGSRHDNLVEYGDIFVVEPYEGKEGYFKLKGNSEKEDDIIDVPEEIVNPEEFAIEDNNGIDISDFDLNLDD